MYYIGVRTSDGKISTDFTRSDRAVSSFYKSKQSNHQASAWSRYRTSDQFPSLPLFAIAAATIGAVRSITWNVSKDGWAWNVVIILIMTIWSTTYNIIISHHDSRLYAEHFPTKSSRKMMKMMMMMDAGWSKRSSVAAGHLNLSLLLLHAPRSDNSCSIGDQSTVHWT